MQIEVAYASSDKQSILQISVPDNTTLWQAIELSGILKLYPDLNNLPVGIFGKQRSLDWPLQDGDRVEIYRPLVIEPMQARRNRAKLQKAKRKKTKKT